ncbi:unnamed protein product [Bursaphelenchus xylophilus]|uniref:Cytochrome b-c1 complex subunit 7 n=1 Tax=Bursaphelenchus xylophilus TaxID=6326 RepID=A0A1I7SFP5_BURXY|nr:unnamed protein product [Bursaphelenchus xylophilus]CAG9131888.1 unnamed protein product [Bursaphelenchus xylophilus]
MTKLPVAAVTRGIKFANESKLMNWARKTAWTYGWGGRQYGLQFHDQCFEPAPEVKEALRRLSLKEPWEFDQRKIRLTRAHSLAMNNQILPKDQWTKWDEETFYLKPYLDEIFKEQKERVESSGFVPAFQAKEDH